MRTGKPVAGDSQGLLAAIALRSDGLPDSCCSQCLRIETWPRAAVGKPPVDDHCRNRVDTELACSPGHHLISHVADYHLAGFVGQVQDKRHRPVAQRTARTEDLDFAAWGCEAK